MQELEAARAEQTFERAKRESEVEELKKHKASLTADQTSLRDQLDTAHQKLQNFESEFMKTSTEEQQSQKALQDSLSALHTRFSRKEEDFRALEESLSSIQDQLVEKEEACRELQSSLNKTQIELSESRNERQSLENNIFRLQDELAGSKRECHDFQIGIQTIQGDLMALKEERHHLQDNLSSLKGSSLDTEAVRQTLEDSLSSMQGTLAKSQEEHQALQKRFEEADNARRDLETGKSKAKGEILALLKRVQESESGIKLFRDFLYRKDVAGLQLPLPMALDHLEGILQSPRENGALHFQQTEAPIKTSETSPRYFEGEINVHGSETPTRMGTDEPKTPTGQAGEASPSKQPGNIVPFSSILQGLSPAHFSAADNDLFDISCVVTHTPERPSAAQELSVPARPEKNNFLPNDTSGKKTQPLGNPSDSARIDGSDQATLASTKGEARPNAAQEQEHVPPKESTTTRKVSFVSDRFNGEKDGVQVPDSQEKSNQSKVLDSSLNEDHQPRNNRWTYSKRQRDTTKQETTSTGTGTSHTEQETRKRPRTSDNASVTQDRTLSELSSRRKSPTRLASGSSCISTNVPNPDHSGPSRGKRRSARRTRGKTTVHA